MRFLSPIQKILLGGVLILLVASSAQAEVISSRIVGGFQYIDSDGNTRPVPNMDISVHRIFDGITGVVDPEDTIVAHITLDQNGEFDLTVNWDHTPGGFLYNQSRLEITLLTQIQYGWLTVKDADEVYRWTLDPEWNEDYSFGQCGVERIVNSNT